MNKRNLRRLVPRHWNKRIFTWGDFEFFCALEGIQVIPEEMEMSGLYTELAGRKTIFLHHKLKGVEKLKVAFHELAHAWLHAPGAHFYLNLDKKTHFEAELVAAVCLIPRHIIRDWRPDEIVEEFGYPIDLIEFRLKVYRQHRI